MSSQSSTVGDLDNSLSGILRHRSCEDFLGDFARSAAKRRPYRTQLKRVDCLLDDPWVDSAGSREGDSAFRVLTVKEACNVIREMRSMFRLQVCVCLMGVTRFEVCWTERRAAKGSPGADYCEAGPSTTRTGKGRRA